MLGEAVRGAATLPDGQTLLSSESSIEGFIIIWIVLSIRVRFRVLVVRVPHYIGDLIGDLWRTTHLVVIIRIVIARGIRPTKKEQEEEE